MRHLASFTLKGTLVLSFRIKKKRSFVPMSENLETLSTDILTSGLYVTV